MLFTFDYKARRPKATTFIKASVSINDKRAQSHDYAVRVVLFSAAFGALRFKPCTTQMFFKKKSF